MKIPGVEKAKNCSWLRSTNVTKITSWKMWNKIGFTAVARTGWEVHLDVWLFAKTRMETTKKVRRIQF